jgi:hypothetical protein
MASLEIVVMPRLVDETDEDGNLWQVEKPVMGLPFGPKARLLLTFFSQQAVFHGPTIWMGKNVTHFVRDGLCLEPSARNIREVRDQLARLIESRITLGMKDGDKDETTVLRIEPEYNGDTQWPELVHLTGLYYLSLCEHAVPLKAEHVHGLAASAMAMDVYTWLAQRLPRVPSDKPHRISWKALATQFGVGRTRLDNFRKDFRAAFKRVQQVYPQARIEETPRGRRKTVIEGGRQVTREPTLKGLLLHYSPPPIPKRPKVDQMDCCE